MRWHPEEERYLKVLHDICNKLSKEYMELYVLSHRFQTRMRIPAIILSSCSGVASFGSSGFGTHTQRYISIGVGVVNVFIAIIQTYESYLKVGDIVSKSLSASLAFKKLADMIYCETFIPVENRIANGITFLRDCFSRYQTILDQSPPLEFHGKKTTQVLDEARSIAESIRTSTTINPIASHDDNVLSLSITPSVTPPSPEPIVFVDMKTMMQRDQPKV